MTNIYLLVLGRDRSCRKQDILYWVRGSFSGLGMRCSLLRGSLLKLVSSLVLIKIRIHLFKGVPDCCYFPFQSSWALKCGKLEGDGKDLRASKKKKKKKGEFRSSCREDSVPISCICALVSGRVGGGQPLLKIIRIKTHYYQGGRTCQSTLQGL